MQLHRFILIIFILISAGAFMAISPGSEESDQIQGNWIKSDSSLKIQIYKIKSGPAAGKFYGKMIWSKASIADSLMGHNLLKDFVYDPESKEWSSGTFLNPQNGKIYKSYISLNKHTLNLRTYTGLGLIGKTFFWNRSQ